MAPGARSKFGAPMFETEVFRMQIYCISEIIVTFLGLFGAPRSHSAPPQWFGAPQWLGVRAIAPLSPLVVPLVIKYNLVDGCTWSFLHRLIILTLMQNDAGRWTFLIFYKKDRFFNLMIISILRITPHTNILCKSLRAYEWLDQKWLSIHFFFLSKNDIG